MIILFCFNWVLFCLESLDYEILGSTELKNSGFDVTTFSYAQFGNWTCDFVEAGPRKSLLLLVDGSLFIPWSVCVWRVCMCVWVCMCGC